MSATKACVVPTKKMFRCMCVEGSWCWQGFIGFLVTRVANVQNRVCVSKRCGVPSTLLVGFDTDISVDLALLDDAPCYAHIDVGHR